MTGEFDDLDSFADDDLLKELDSLKGLLDPVEPEAPAVDLAPTAPEPQKTPPAAPPREAPPPPAPLFAEEEEEIPLLQDVVLPGEAPSAEEAGLAAAMQAASAQGPTAAAREAAPDLAALVEQAVEARLAQLRPQLEAELLEALRRQLKDTPR